MLNKLSFALALMTLGSVSLLAQDAKPQSSGSSSSKESSSSKLDSGSPKALQADKPLYQQDDAQTDSLVPEIKATPTYTSSFIQNTIDGGPSFKRPVLIPTFSFSQSLTSGQSSVGNGMIWRGQQNVAGSLQFRWDVGNSGSMVYNGTGLWNSYQGDAQTVQSFGYTQRLRFGRWMASITDQATYSPQSSFGFGGLQGIYGSSALGSLGGSFIPSGIVPGTEPNQSVLTTNADRVSNTTAGELQYSLTARTAVRAGGSYGIIRGIDTSLLDGNQYAATAGLDYRLDPSDTIGMNYSYSVYSFPDSQEETRAHSAGLSFARRLTARLSSQAYVGAQYSDSSQFGIAHHQLGWGANGYLSYHRVRNSVGLNFYHGVSGGSGVFLGANTTNVGLSFSRQVTHTTGFSLTGGFARNNSLQRALANDHTNTFYAGASASRSLGRYASLYFGYTLQQQTLGAGVLSANAFNGRQHMFNLGLSWSFRPIRLAQN